MAEDKKKDSPTSEIVLGALIIVAGIGLYFWFASLETEGGGARINWIIALLYKTLGKWGVLLVLCAIGAWMLYSGIQGTLAGKREPRRVRSDRRR